MRKYFKNMKGESKPFWLEGTRRNEVLRVASMQQHHMLQRVRRTLSQPSKKEGQ